MNTTILMSFGSAGINGAPQVRSKYSVSPLIEALDRRSSVDEFVFLIYAGFNPGVKL